MSRIEVSYTEEERAAFRRVAWARSYRGAEGRMFYMFGSGCIFAVAGGVGIGLSGLANLDGAELAAVLICAGFMLGVWSPSAWYPQVSRRDRGKLDAPFSLRIAPNLLRVDFRGSRQVYTRGAFDEATLGKGLLILWRRQWPGIVIPTRLLDAEQRRMLAALAAHESDA